MTQEEKRLLFIELCMRLPYKVMGHATWTYMETNGEVKQAEKDRPIEVNDLYAVWDFKPYLRPMSSMTEEEDEEYSKTLYVTDYGNFVTSEPTIRTFDWLNAHHFDYRDLIGKGLALKAPEGMYNIKEQ